PIDPLPLGETITATVSDTVTDLQGMTLLAPVTWSFEMTADPAHILITEVAVTDSAQEFIEIHNPTASAIPLDGYGLADSTWIGPPMITQYYLIPELVQMGLPLIGTADDFAMGFPSGASIAPGEYQTVALAGSTNFDSAWGVPPTYEISDDGAIPDTVLDMVEIFPGSIGTTARLTNSGELVVLFFWNGYSDLVFDVDYVIWGDAITDPGTPEAVDKTGVSLDGPDSDSFPTSYLPDTALGIQEVVTPSAHSPGMSYQRLAPLLELAEMATGGNGITGHDETSEGLAVSNGSWTWTDPATPNLPGP
ncbi:MAG: hypothetical protein O6952_00075, partial [Planctomycetota bacterium]|nr:hypothetical protein [Planctomycetota bacterium]